jgi:hypothetical protein
MQTPAGKFLVKCSQVCAQDVVTQPINPQDFYVSYPCSITGQVWALWSFCPRVYFVVAKNGLANILIQIILELVHGW